MGRLKTFRKYILWIIGFYIFTMFCTYVGLNATYEDITAKQDIPTQMEIKLAQATKVNGRIYGEVTSTQENDLNGKYIKVEIYNKSDILTATKYLKIENTNYNEPKKFAVNFTAESIESYTIDIVDDSQKVEEEAARSEELFGDIFTKESLRTIVIIGLILGIMR